MKSSFFLLLALCVILYVGSALKPSVKNSLKIQVLNDLKNKIVPVISKKVENMKLQDIKFKKGDFEILVFNIQIKVKPFKPEQIIIEFLPNSSTMRFGGKGFSMQGSASIKVTWKFLNKEAHADITIADAGLLTQITMFTNNNRINMKVDGLELYIDAKNIKIILSGDPIIKVLEWLIQALGPEVIKVLNETVKKTLPPIITEQLNKLLNSLPTDINIGNMPVAIRYGFPYAPYNRDGYLYTGIYAFVYARPNPIPPKEDPPDIPEYESTMPRGIQFFLSDYVLNSATESAFKAGFMKIAFEKELFGFNIKMECAANSPPILSLDNAFKASIQSVCFCTVNKNPDLAFKIVSTSVAEVTQYAKAAVIFFNIDKLMVSKIEYIVPKPMDIEWFKAGINQVLETVAAYINSDLGGKGIPLPTIKGVDFTDMMQEIKKRYIVVGCNPKFDFEWMEQTQ